jgi:Transposase DDE domain group 1
LVRELDERLGLSALIAGNIMDDRRGKNTQLPLPDLLRQSIYSRLAGYEDVNDAERLSQDPTFRLIGSEKIWDRGAALPSRLHWFETEVLSQDENLEGLSRINRELLAKAEAMDSPQRVVLDMDSTEIPVYGEQDSSCRFPTGRLIQKAQQTRDSRAVDQGRQAGGEDDPPFLSSVPLEPSATGAEPAGLQSGKFVAASGFAERD